MLFNSLEYLLFFPTVFCLYWFAFQRNLRWQNTLLLVASYVFYGWWDWRFLSLIALSTVVDYWVGIRIHAAKSKRRRRSWLWVSLAVNLGLLGIFKYYDFFVESFVEAVAGVGYQLHPRTLQLILPVGISFYTFQTLSYSIDIYRRRMEPARDFIAFAAFVAFFPQLVAGPIERAANLLPQLQRPRRFAYRDGVIGLRLILWGLFKKVAIADALAPVVDDIFAHAGSYSGGTLLLGAVYFAFQIYADFSGYSDIALGTARLFGIRLMTNFRFPYFSRNIGEFWRRWHISLSTWFRDYLYIPLGGSRGSKWTGIRNIFIIFLVSGLWHGASWTFVAWGALHALLFVPSFLRGANRRYRHTELAAGSYLPSWREALQVLATFSLVTLSWVFFRAQDMRHAAVYLKNMIRKIDLPGMVINPYDHQPLVFENALLVFFIANEYVLYKRFRLLSTRSLRFTYYSFLLIVIITSLQLAESRSFIYFQF